ncbi:uncharacterized protein LOC142823061 [Pelodiscus sinensis]|uniref:uncharacterized protein LOC142823061 n=1 Tax=Pelodiscus sinensis TaxID=13735 RepID=UPI003F6D1E7F
MPRQVALTDLNCNLPISQQTKVKLNSLVSAGEAMAAATTGKKFQDEVTCPICLEYFDDPVALDCDHSFCRACITQCWGGLTADVSCPQCRRVFPQGNLRPNRQLRSFVDAARELRLQAGRKPAPERLCEKHQEPLKLFCREDEIPICLVCDRSKGHRGHTVIPAEEAAEEFQERLQAQLKTLRAEREKLLGLKVSREETSQEYLKQTQAERQKIVAEFQQLRQFLEEQERLLLAQLKKLDKMIVKAQTETVTKLSVQISHLRERIRELEGKCQKPASEFLQDIRSTLSRCEEGRAQQPEEMAPELEERVREFSQQTTALSKTLGEFRGTLPAALEASLGVHRPANVTLDPDTAYPWFVLLGDGKRVRWTGTRQPQPDTLERFDYVPCVLGSEGFTSGRHYWEVEGGDGRWAVGVARESVSRKGEISLSTENGIWAVGRWWWGQPFQALTDPHTPLPLSPPSRIQVYLDCDRGQVTFIDADTEAPIFTFPPGSLPGERIRPWIWVGDTDTELRLSPFSLSCFCPSPSCLLLFLLLPPCQRKPAWPIKGQRADTHPTAMAARATPGELQEEATCSVCLGYLTEPVTIACGHNFCRACLTQYCEEREAGGLTCPQCRAPFQKGKFKPNTQLNNIVQKLRQLGPKPGDGEAGDLCERHQERLKLFCEDDGAAICLVCEKSRNHKSHTVVPIEEAAQEYQDPEIYHLMITASQVVTHLYFPYSFLPVCEQKVKLCTAPGRILQCLYQEVIPNILQKRPGLSVYCCIGLLTDVRVSNVPNENQALQSGSFSQLSKESLIYLIHLIRWPVADTNHNITPFVSTSKEKLQEALVPLREALAKGLELTAEEKAKSTKWQRKVQAKRETIAAEFNKLHTLLREEEQLLLQRLAEEEQETLQRLQENVAKLSQQSTSLQQLITEMEGKCLEPAVELLKGARDTLSRSKNLKLQEPEAVPTDLQHVYRIPARCLEMREMLKNFAVDMTLDPDTAHPKLVVSMDRKSVSCGATRQALPDTPARFEKYTIVLGAEGLAGGRRYWEVEVGDTTLWHLGVCRDSVSRKGQFSYKPKNGFWVMTLSDGKYEAFTSPMTPVPVSARPRRVGIFLDYEAGEVSFYNVTDRSHLFTFTDTFSGTLRPYFLINANGASLTICPVPVPAGEHPCTVN